LLLHLLHLRLALLLLH